MLKWAAIFFIIAIIAALLGFTDIAAGAAQVAKILFYIALAIFVLFLALALFVGSKLN